MQLSFLFISALLCLGANSMAEDTILIVVTNHDEIADTGTPTGYYLSEVAHPWHVFTEAGYEVEFASPKGSFAPMDPKSFDLEDPVNQAFWHGIDKLKETFQV